MDIKKIRLSFKDGLQQTHITHNSKSVNISHLYSTEEKVEFLGRLPAFAPKPVCKFIINGRTMFGRLEHKQESNLFIRHKFGKKVIKYHIKQVQSVDILKY